MRNEVPDFQFLDDSENVHIGDQNIKLYMFFTWRWILHGRLV